MKLLNMDLFIELRAVVTGLKNVNAKAMNWRLVIDNRLMNGKYRTSQLARWHKNRLGGSFAALCVACTVLSGAVPAFALNAPNNLHTVANDFAWIISRQTVSVVLAWTDNTGLASSNWVEHSSDGGVTWTHMSTQGVNNPAASEEIPFGSTYSYRVMSLYNGQQSGYSSVISVSAIVPPYDLVAYSSSPGAVNFNISSPQGAATIPWASQQVLERSTNNFATHDDLIFSSTATSFTDTTSFLPGVTYGYRLRLINSTNNTRSAVNERTGWANLAPNAVPPAPQYLRSSTLNVDAAGTGAPTSVRLWVSDNSLTETGFLLERSSDGVNWTTVTTASPITAKYGSQVLWAGGNNYFDDANLVSGVNYQYRVSATNAVGKSQFATNSISLPLGVAAGPTDWYVSPNANGNNTGTSWANAWANPGSINWVRLAPGHTVHIAGGDYYPGGIVAGKSGAPGQPITFEASREAGHNGRVVFHGGGIDIGSYEYLSFEGRKDTNLTWNGLSQFNITNNINWEISGSPGAAVFTSHGNGFQVRGLEVHDVGIMTTNMGEIIPVGNIASAFFYNSDTYFTNAEIGYCYIHDVNDYVFNPNFGQAKLGDYLVHDNIMANYNGGIMRGGSMDFYQNICGPIKYPGTEHGNGLACSPNNQRIYNNIFWGANASVLYANTHGAIPNQNFYYYNNTLYRGPQNYIDAAGCFEFTCSEQTGFITYSNVVIANNTIYKHTPGSMIGTSMNYGIGMTNWLVVNNILVSPDDGSPNDTAYNMGSNPPNQSDPSHYIFDFNLIVPPTKQINYAGTLYADANALNAATQFTHNGTNMPLFVDVPNWNFQLATTDTAAVGRGTNLTALAGICPGIDRDALGNSRGAVWDLGAFQHASAGGGTVKLALTESGTGSGTVTSSPAGINCGGTCTAAFSAGTTVVLTATPAAGSGFAGWSGTVSGSATALNVVLNSDTTVVATFTNTVVRPPPPTGLRVVGP